jgi:hypothetical protein
MTMTDCQHRITVLENEIKMRQDEIRELKCREDLLSMTFTTTCPACEGSREERYIDAAGDTDTRACSVCKGYGRIGPIKCKCGKVIDIDMIETRRQKYPKCPWCGELIRK